jgi:tetratricopeptide (TPR) repeat protein
MAVTTSEKTKTKALEELLEMAKDWEKEKGKIQHAIEAYERVIGIAPESEEANQARDTLFEIAKRFEKEGKKYSAYYLYQKIGYGKEGLSKRAV